MNLSGEVRPVEFGLHCIADEVTDLAHNSGYVHFAFYDNGRNSDGKAQTVLSTLPRGKHGQKLAALPQ